MPPAIHKTVEKTKDGQYVVDTNHHKTPEDRKAWYDEQAFEHSLQMRLVPGGGWYSIQGDLAHNFKPMTVLVARQLLGVWPRVRVLMEKLGVNENELVEGFRAYAMLLKSAAEDRVTPFEIALEQSGWDKLRPEVELILSAAIGRVTATFQFHRIRGAQIGSSEIAVTTGDILRMAAMSETELAKR